MKTKHEKKFKPGNFLPSKPLALFVIAYLGYVVTELFLGKTNTIDTRIITTSFIIVIIISIVWSIRKKDEVQQSIINKAYSTGFWLSFLFLYIDTIYESFGVFLEAVIPLWTIPIIGWLLGYLAATIMYR